MLELADLAAMIKLQKKSNQERSGMKLVDKRVIESS